jgi:hypothetical protein
MWLPEASRFANARSTNISRTGVLLSAPMSTPVKCGQIVEVNFPRTRAIARQKGSFARIKAGRVVRLDKENLLNDGMLGIAVEFSKA